MPGVIISATAAVPLTALLWVLKRRAAASNSKLTSDGSHRRAVVVSNKACARSRPFTYHELEEATEGFSDELKILETSKSTLYAGTLAAGGFHVAVQRVSCREEKELIRFQSNAELLAAVKHRNMADVIGWSIDRGPPTAVYRYPENGNLSQNLNRGAEKSPTTTLDWCRRLKIATETANFLAFLQHEFSPPVFHRDLRSGFVFLDADFVARVSGFDLLQDPTDHQIVVPRDVYNMGLILLEIITGDYRTAAESRASLALEKIKNGKLEEMVDPALCYHEQPYFRREEIRVVADVATRCLLFGGEQGKFGMIDVARELGHVVMMNGGGVGGGSRRGPAASAAAALEETFSNSSLLQMVSMSPESIYVP